MTTPAAPDVLFDRQGPVATITLCRPEVLNAQTPQMWTALREFGRQLPGDVRVVVVRAQGRAFSSGIDLSVVKRTFAEMTSYSDDEVANRIAFFQEAFSWLRRPDLVSIAAVQGHAIGAGFQLALACDLRVVTDDAKFTMAEVTLGLVPDLTGTKRLVDLVGYGRALEICVTGRRVDAPEAYRIGLANVVVPGDELDRAVDDLAAAVLSANRDAVVEIKALLSGAGERDYPAQEAAEREAQVRRIRDLAGQGE
ncbi:enoyl-CoA hydratase/isomerase family protein [Rugosimonospora acidiphila]|uniref:Enoyl-CoA hydratase/isomerase family protein n=1 Tax=Rugosimonospora acidiphila TaxID=556531 RepID=A0ABP9S6M4_9ACTN